MMDVSLSPQSLQALSLWTSPALLLVLGISFSALGLIRTPAKHAAFKKLGTQILQISVMALGFKIPLSELIATSRSGILLTGASVAAILGAGWILSRWIRLPQDQALLISSGTAICGGSAIAAVSGALKPKSIDMGIALAVVFLLNAAGLVVFPPVGHALQLGDVQFATWAALAIHDTSSVVGAAAQWGDGSLALATTIKLSRTLWIFPMVLGMAYLRKRSGQAISGSSPAFPKFILGFIAASALRSWDTPLQSGVLQAVPWIAPLATIGFGLSLGLIGLSISRTQLKTLTWRPVVYGVALWAITAVVALGYVRTFI